MSHNPYQDTEDFVFAHMSPQEIKELAHLQGGMEYIPGTKTPTFQRMKMMIEHPYARNGIAEWERSNFAGGGEVDGLNDFMRNSGRYGDTEFVQLPRSLANLFDRALTGGQPSINPRTGRREYFLGGLFSGLSNIFKPISHIISPIASAIAPIAGTALTHLAPQLGNMAGTALGGLASSMGAGPLGASLGGMAGNVLGSAASNLGQYMQGTAQTAPADIARQAASQFGQQAAPAVGQHLGNMAQNYSAQIQNPYLSSALNHAGTLGGQMVGGIGSEGASAFGENRAPQYGTTVGNIAQNYLGGIQNPIAAAGAHAINTYMNPQSDQQMVS